MSAAPTDHVEGQTYATDDSPRFRRIQIRAETRSAVGRRPGMTILVSIFGVAGRFAGDLLTSALGWASSLLFGRVPRSHQIFRVLMIARTFL